MNKNYIKNSKRGISLIIVMSVLIIISTLGILFVRLAIYDQGASSNYSAYIRAKLCAWAGIDRTLALIYENLLDNYGAIQWDEENLRYKSIKNLEEACKEGEEDISLFEGRKENLDNFSFSGIVGPGTYTNEGDFYSLRVEGTSYKLNINSFNSSNDDKKESNKILNKILAKLAHKYGASDSSNIANILCPIEEDRKNFSTIEEVRELLKEKASNDNLVNNEENLEKFLSNLCMDSWINPSTYAPHKKNKLAEPSSYFLQKRAPININYVSKKLLTSLIECIKGTTYFYDTSISFSNSQENELNLPKFYDIKFTNGEKIADYIIDRRNIKDWSEFERVIKSMKEANEEENLFPIPNSTSDVNKEEWIRAHIDTLLSNFDFNIVDNYRGLNRAVYRKVCKGDLIDKDTKEPAISTEVCFDDIGSKVYIESLGVISTNNRIIAKCSIKFNINIGEKVLYCTQSEFNSNSPTRENIRLYPSINGENNYSGWIAPKLTFPDPWKDFNSTNNFIDLYFYKYGEGENNIYPANVNNELKYNKLKKNIYGIESHNINYMGNDEGKPINITLDGLVNKDIQFLNKGKTYYYEIPSIVQKDSPYTPYLRVANFDSNIVQNVGNYKGFLGLWLRIDERIRNVEEESENNEEETDNDDHGAFFGIIGITTVSSKLTNDTLHNDYLELNKAREGTQLYIYINSRGILRVVRLYWGIYYDERINKWRGIIEPYLEPDPDRKIVRREVEQEIDWKKGEWHYIAIEWNDKIEGQNSLKLWIDTVPKDEKKVGNFISSSTGRYGVLNERNPVPVVFINGFYRKQHERGGFFRIDTTVNVRGNITIGRLLATKNDNYNLNFNNDYDPLDIFSENSEYSSYIEFENYPFILGDIKYRSYIIKRDDEPEEVELEVDNYSYSKVSNTNILKSEFKYINKDFEENGESGEENNKKLNYTIKFPSKDSAFLSLELNKYYAYPVVDFIEVK